MDTVCFSVPEKLNILNEISTFQIFPGADPDFKFDFGKALL